MSSVRTLPGRTVVIARTAVVALGITALTATAGAQAPTPSPAPLSALAPANLAKPRPKPPFDLTGTWFVDLSAGFDKWRMGPPYPKFKGKAAQDYAESQKARAEGKSYHDFIGQCYPAGMPTLMTRVWPIAMIQLPTAVYMVHGFENSLRIIYLDGRRHTDPDVVVRTFNGESIGRWEGDALVVDTRSMISDKHIVDDGLPVSDEFRIMERIRLINGGQTLEIRTTLIDPKYWEGEWTQTHRWRRADDQDITEVVCTPDLNEHLPATKEIITN